MYEKLYKELVLRYNELEGRTKQLEEENARLRQRLGMANRSDTNNVKRILRYSTLLYLSPPKNPSLATRIFWRRDRDL